MSDKDEILHRGDLVAVRFLCHKISATRALPRAFIQDVLGDAVKLPEGLQALLRQEVFDPSVLRAFGAVEQRVLRFLFQKGVSTPLGTIINPAHVPEVIAKLEEAQKDYKASVPELVQSFEQACAKVDAAIADEFGGTPYYERLVQAIAKVRPSIEELETTVDMEWYLFHIGQVNEGFDVDAEQRTQTGVVQLRKDLPGRLFQEVATFFSQRIENMGADVIRPKSIEATQRVIEKVRSMAFLDPAIGTMADQLTKGFDPFIGGGSLRDGERDRFLAIVRALSSQRHLVRCYELGRDPIPAPAAPAPTPVQVAAQPTAAPHQPTPTTPELPFSAVPKISENTPVLPDVASPSSAGVTPSAGMFG